MNDETPQVDEVSKAPEVTIGVGVNNTRDRVVLVLELDLPGHEKPIGVKLLYTQAEIAALAMSLVKAADALHKVPEQKIVVAGPRALPPLGKNGGLSRG